MPRVSVVMAVHDEEAYIREAIDSILRQTFGDFELIVVDDGSTDSTPVVLASYDDPRLRVYSQGNSGQSSALNRAIRLASGEYIARMDGDDISLPHRLEREVHLLDANPEIGLVGTWCVKVNMTTGRKKLQPLPEEDAAIRKYMIVDNPFIHSSVMIRRSALDRIGLYEEGLIWQDYDLWLRLSKHYRMANIPEPLVIRRKHPANITSTTRKSKVFWERFRIQWKACRVVGLRVEGVAAMTKSLAGAMAHGIFGH